MHTIDVSAVEIDQHCLGNKWTVTDTDRLARIVAIVAMGQSLQAELIINKYGSAEPAFVDPVLIKDSIRMLTVQRDSDPEGTGYPIWHRDGFIFEIVSWIAARQECGKNGLLKPPHIKPTTQGLDGLQLDLNDEKDRLARTVIFEDKCSDNPKATFKNKVLPAFIEHHQNARSRELVATTNELLQKINLAPELALAISRSVLSLNIRAYRSALAINQKMDNKEKRAYIFREYDKIDKISQKQRLANTLVIPADDIRPWFQGIADSAIAFLESKKGGQNV